MKSIPERGDSSGEHDIQSKHSKNWNYDGGAASSIRIPQFFAASAALAIALVYTTASGAVASTDSHGCHATEPAVNTYVKVCFKTNGDQVWVLDREPDGASAVGYIQGPGGNYSYYCVNSLGAGNWAHCDRDFPENAYYVYRGYTKNGTNGELRHETDSAIEANVNGT